MASTKSIILKLLGLSKQDVSLMKVNFAGDLMILKVLNVLLLKIGISTAFFCLF